jgi:hypothetical protein
VAAACHIHSSWSYDASWTLEALAAAFVARGQRVMLMTEHDRGFSESRYAEFRQACERASTTEMFVMPGMEYSDADNRVHVLTWGAPFVGEGLPTETMLKAVTEQGGVAVLAHPDRRAAWECVEPEWVQYLLGVEVWNRKYDGWAPGQRGESLVALAGATRFVGLDFHARNQFFPLSMLLPIHGTVDENSVLSALKSRRCTPQAFGRDLDGAQFERRLPLLKYAERGRRTLATLKRYSRSRLPV